MKRLKVKQKHADPEFLKHMQSEMQSKAKTSLRPVSDKNSESSSRAQSARSSHQDTNKYFSEGPSKSQQAIPYSLTKIKSQKKKELRRRILMHSIGNARSSQVPHFRRKCAHGNWLYFCSGCA